MSSRSFDSDNEPAIEEMYSCGTQEDGFRRHGRIRRQGAMDDGSQPRP